MVLQVPGRKNNHDQTFSGASVVATHFIVTGNHKFCAGKLPRGDIDNLSEIV